MKSTRSGRATPARGQQNTNNIINGTTAGSQATPFNKYLLQRKISDLVKEPVLVYCRIRPLQSENELTCVKVKSSTRVVLTPPEFAINYKISQKETQYIFKQVFDANTKQNDIFSKVAQPLVENLIKGKNGLLFTYGVTGGGKTYTMTGDPDGRGIMPRCLDVLFKTISNYQTKKFVFKPDRLNGFEILTETDALLERQAEMNARFGRIGGVNYGGNTGTINRQYKQEQQQDPEIASIASTDVTSLSGIDEDNMYAVFITYVEIYNKSVFDLLEEGELNRNPQSKLIREDANHNMFVHGITEVEVKNVQEAIDIFKIGQKRKRMAHTILNAESSRSHSVFTIRLVQSPTDSQGENIMNDRSAITVSQLSLVDLAGSERTNRTKNTGERLREASNINNSLLTLRTCLEILRENQLHGVAKKVPYRDSKLTHIFKNYFDGDGQVRMIVCINPRAEDYDETAQVMKFAEMTQEVQTIVPAVMPKQDIGLTPGRRKANQIFKMAVNNLNEMGNTDARKLPIDINLIYSLGSNIPDLKLTTPEANVIIDEVKQILEHRITKRKHLLKDYNARQEQFRLHLMKLERDNIHLKTENSSILAMLKQERQKICNHENKIIIHEQAIDNLNKKLLDRDELINELQDQLSQKSYLLSQKELEKEKQKKKYTSKMAVATDKMNKELETKLLEQKHEMQDRIRAKEHKLKLVTEIINANSVDNIPTSMKLHENRPQAPAVGGTTGISSSEIATHRPRGIVANTRHRRSKSTDNCWLEHRAMNPVPLGTILQPHYKNRKSITKLTDVKDFTNSKASKYCLVSQQADTDGELETRLYKGNVIPTMGGGAQIIFDDVECLKQKSPTYNRKRSSDTYENNLIISPKSNQQQLSAAGAGATPSQKDIASRCSVGIEGHTQFNSNNKKPRT